VLVRRWVAELSSGRRVNLICGFESEYVVGSYGAADTLEFKIANRFNRDSILNS
jgi:hypothetical protein